MSLQWIAEHFDKSQIIVLFFALSFIWLKLRSGQKETQFRVREADRVDANRARNPSALADAKLTQTQKKTAAPLSLPGIRLEGEAYEILGVRENASEAEIMRAYKDAIKLYHPDRIQGLPADQMKFYQEASAKLNQAKDEMLSKVRSTPVR